MKVGDYVRTKGCITKIDSCTCWKAKNQWYISYKLPDGSEWASAVTDEFKISPNIIDLLQPMDLIYVDIDNNYAGGIIVPRIAETQAELNVMIDLIKSGKWILKGVVTNEHLDSVRYKVGE